MTGTLSHWNEVYKTKKHTQISWYQEHSTISLDWILAYSNKEDSIIDVGCGVSILADNLLDKGYQNISLLELSTTALDATKLRLKAAKDRVTFYNENILDFETHSSFNLWHDRAVFHFLITDKDQQTYLNKLNKYLNKGGFFLLATFSPDGPKKCSDLDIVQYDKVKITQLLGDGFKFIKITNEIHPHPNGNTQNFNYFLFQKK